VPTCREIDDGLEQKNAYVKPTSPRKSLPPELGALLIANEPSRLRLAKLKRCVWEGGRTSVTRIVIGGDDKRGMMIGKDVTTRRVVTTRHPATTTSQAMTLAEAFTFSAYELSE
jgi:hypothetical protein